jgi:cytochrome c-type biogenesis protein CcmE
MKKSYIIATAIIAAAIGIIIATAGDTSTYVDFSQAYKLAEAGKTSSIHIVGSLKKDGNGTIVGLENGADKLSCSFILVDEQNKEERVIYNEPAPADLGKSEKIVVIGEYRGNQFVAEKILLKCPSKYQEQKLKAGV